jgi:hypothetical protein
MNLGVFCKFSEQVPEQATTDESACRRRPPLPPPPCVPHEPKRLRLLDPLANPLPPLLERAAHGPSSSGAAAADIEAAARRELAGVILVDRRQDG